MQPVSSANFLNLVITSCSREKRYQALPTFPYCKRRKAGRGLGTRLRKRLLSVANLSMKTPAIYKPCLFSSLLPLPFQHEVLVENVSELFMNKPLSLHHIVTHTGLLVLCVHVREKGWHERDDVCGACGLPYCQVM